MKNTVETRREEKTGLKKRKHRLRNKETPKVAQAARIQLLTLPTGTSTTSWCCSSATRLFAGIGSTIKPSSSFSSAASQLRQALPIFPCPSISIPAAFFFPRLCFLSFCPVRAPSHLLRLFSSSLLLSSFFLSFPPFPFPPAHRRSASLKGSSPFALLGSSKANVTPLLVPCRSPGTATRLFHSLLCSFQQLYKRLTSRSRHSPAPLPGTKRVQTQLPGLQRFRTPLPPWHVVLLALDSLYRYPLPRSSGTTSCWATASYRLPSFHF